MPSNLGAVRLADGEVVKADAADLRVGFNASTMAFCA
jgi:hypothetical protein